MNNIRWVLYALLSIWVCFLLVDFHLDVKDRDCFTWMDPQQYHGFAVDMVGGVRPATDFEIPSLFPFFLAPLVTLDSEVGTALWANVFAAGLLFVAVYFLVREIPVRTAPLLVWAIVLCSPLLVGLSRSLYLEFTLTAMVSLAFAIYLKMISSEDLRFKVGFAAVFYLGILTKMTFPLFFVLPAAVHVTALMLARRWRESLHLMAAFVLPALLAVATVWLFFPRAFAYYLNFGNTAIPIMYLVGPLGRWSVESFTYYLWILSTFMLGLSAPLLLLSFFLPRWHWREFQWSQMLTPRATLWLWLIGPLILLVPQLVKEPRHVAPCIVPAILLIVSAIESIERRTLRLAMLALLARGFGGAIHFGDNRTKPHRIFSRSSLGGRWLAKKIGHASNQSTDVPNDTSISDSGSLAIQPGHSACGI